MLSHGARERQRMLKDSWRRTQTHVSVSPSSLMGQLMWMMHNYVFLSRWFLETCRRKKNYWQFCLWKNTQEMKIFFNTFIDFVKKNKMPLFKLITITTDGAPTSGFIALCKQSESFPDILNYHCNINQQTLCGKTLHMKEVMDVVCVLCPGQEPTERIISCSSGGERCRTHWPAAPHRCEVTKQRYIFGQVHWVVARNWKFPQTVKAHGAHSAGDYWHA